MRRNTYLIVAMTAFCLSTLISNGQDTEAPVQDSLPPLNTGFVTFGLGVNGTSFFGDVGSNQNRNFTNNVRWGAKLTVERRFGNILGLGVHARYGKLAQNERSLTRNLNFEANTMQFGADIQAHFDNRSDIHFAPFIMAGFSYMTFDPYGDLKDENGNTYYYWSDGIIRKVPEFDENGDIIAENQNLRPEDVEIKRDYEYETQLTNSSDPDMTAYQRNTFAIPLTFGLKYKVKEFWEARIYGSYNLTFSDYIDNYAASGNDAFVEGGFSIHYTWGKKYIPPLEEKYLAKDEILKTLLKDDSDRDKVLDFDDQCSHTPRGVKVEREDPKFMGCPLDTDKDGVPDFLDKEPNTAKGAVVNRFGITLTDEDIERMREIRENTYSARISKFYESEEDGTISSGILGEFDKEIEARDSKLSSAIPADLRFADFNNDGIIQSEEVTMAIDCFFEGADGCDVSVSTIMEMIDFFFEQ
ncbi:MAG: hypothetical protein MRY83_09260 [Flavobacteriales bacterium]|nr:hypothetical protein [Flavobacteriales bacterium]